MTVTSTNTQRQPATTASLINRGSLTSQRCRDDTVQKKTKGRQKIMQREEGACRRPDVTRENISKNRKRKRRKRAGKKRTGGAAHTNCDSGRGGEVKSLTPHGIFLPKRGSARTRLQRGKEEGGGTYGKSTRTPPGRQQNFTMKR